MLRTHSAALRIRRRTWSIAVRCAVAAGLAAAVGCQHRPDTAFSVERATRHVGVLASGIGCRPTGTDANRRAREYIADQLRSSGFTVRFQEANARTGTGMTTPVVNVIATRPGRRAETIALVSHYDSPPESRAAADDGLGVAVCLEAGRVLAARPDPRYSLLVAITDGEELGLMGARELRTTPEFARVKAYMNFEAVGTNGPARLFQAGPGNSWLTAAWARAASAPSGSSLYTGVYRNLPNDTDFTVLRQSGAPGLNFAPTGNTVAYHTPLDTPAHLETATIARLGDNTVRTVRALDDVDISARTADDGTFFDVAGLTAVSCSGSRTKLLAIVAFVLGLLAAFKAFRAARGEVGLLRLVVSAIWALLSVAAIAGAVSGACWLLRAQSRLENPWYGSVGIFFALVIVAVLCAIWLVALLGRRLPTMVGPSGSPSCVWTLTLPVWAALAAAAQWFAPGAGYLVAIPLLTAALLVLLLPVGRHGVGRFISLVVLVVAAALWVPLFWTIFEFIVGLFGSLQVTAPVWLFGAVALGMLITVGPALAGVMLGRESRVFPAGVIASVLVLGIVALSWMLAVEPAYNGERPERRSLRYVQDNLQNRALWEVGAHERTAAPTGSSASGPHGWEATDEPPAVSLRIGRVAGPFRYRARAAGLATPPLEVRSATRPVEGSQDVWLDTTATPLTEGTAVTFALPWGVRPVESNLPGVVRDGRWSATVMPAPAWGATLRVRLTREALAKLSDARVVAIMNGTPGGQGWQRLPRWLPQQAVVWRARSHFILAWPAPAGPVPEAATAVSEAAAVRAPVPAAGTGPSGD